MVAGGSQIQCLVELSGNINAYMNVQPRNIIDLLITQSSHEPAEIQNLVAEYCVFSELHSI